MINVGLTGGIASGKNFIAGLFKKKGCYVLDADDVSREVMKPYGEAYQNVIDAFGQAILTGDGLINRGALREIITKSDEKRILLESIVHPSITTRSKRYIKEIAAKDNNAIVVNHAPLLLESHFAEKKNSIIIVIWCTPETQKKRLLKRGHPPYEEGVKFLGVQMPFEEKIKYAHHIINNNGTPEEAQAEVDRVYNLLRVFEYTERLNKRQKQRQC